MPGRPNSSRSSLHVRRDDAEVLGDQRQPAQVRFAAASNSFAPRALTHRPLAAVGRSAGISSSLRSRGSGRGGSTSTCASVARNRSTHQAKPSRRIAGPVVERVAPALAGPAEVVRRHAGDGRRPAVAVEQEQLRVRPDVGRVGGDEDRQVADQPDALLRAYRRRARQLAEEQELARTGAGRSRPRARVSHPPGPRGSRRTSGFGQSVHEAVARALLQGHEQGEVVEPAPSAGS